MRQTVRNIMPEMRAREVQKHVLDIRRKAPRRKRRRRGRRRHKRATN
jgi:hypothetical protein